jgi:hypothetical protein
VLYTGVHTCNFSYIGTLFALTWISSKK